MRISVWGPWVTGARSTCHPHYGGPFHAQPVASMCVVYRGSYLRRDPPPTPRTNRQHPHRAIGCPYGTEDACDISPFRNCRSMIAKPDSSRSSLRS